MRMRIKKLHPDAQMPFYATPGSNCFDLHCLQEASIPPDGTALFSTGLVFEVPEEYVMLVFSRSGHGFNGDVRLANCVGVIDSDYRGEVKVKLTNDSGSRTFRVAAGDRVAQAALFRCPQVTFELAEELGETERGANGFGSSGK